MLGIIEYNIEGKPMCEICGKFFDRVASHVRQKHNMSERDYKLKFGFDLKKGICSIDSSIKSRNAVFNNYNQCILSNLTIKGSLSRFKIGDKGRTKDKVSEQTRIMLSKQFSQFHKHKD